MPSAVNVPPISLPCSLALPTWRHTLRKTIPATGMILLILVLLRLVPPALAGETVLVDGIPHVMNPATPRDGVQTLDLQEQWRAGGEDDEIFFGVVTNAISDDEGNIYLLDMQLSEVQVYSPAGEQFKTLSREGEGPGEIQRPADLLFMPDGSLGIVQMFPGKVVKIDLDGNPAGSFAPFANDPTAGGFNGLNDVAYRNGHLICCGTKMSRTDDGFLRTNYLSAFQDDGSEKQRYLEKSSQPDFSRPQFNEKEDYFVNEGRWAVGPEGRIYAAPERDSYAIHVYGPDGNLEKVIEREMVPYKRTKAEMDRVGEGMVVIVNGRRMEIEKNIEETDPAIAGLYVKDDGDLWVLSSRGTHEQPDGIFQTYDVFDPAGNFIKQVAVACEGDSQEDGLILLDDGRVLVIKGMTDAARTMFGEADAEEDEEAAEDTAAEIEPLEVICYAVI